MKRIGFDNDKYIKLQSERIEERIAKFGGKLYLEFGGKLFDDYHAARVLPGFKADSKVKMLLKLKDQAEIVIVISAYDIEKNKVRGDLGITYDDDVLRLIDAFREIGLFVGSVVITKYSAQPAAAAFQKRLETLGIKVYCHYSIAGYPANVALIVSEDGYGKNEYVETVRPLVVVTAPGPGSGKMATCLSQLYHENKRGIKSGYAKFETFPIWNVPLKHPVNLAYEAATVDLEDNNVIDNFHLSEYGITTVNYNRDIESFPVLKAILKEISGESVYKSPTDMGVNMAGYAIFDDDAVKKSACDEIIRRYYNTLVSEKQGLSSSKEVDKMRLVMQDAGLKPEDRNVVIPALEKAKNSGVPSCALELNDSTIITGKNGELLGAAAALLLNALKTLSKLNDDVLLISESILEPIRALKSNHFKDKHPFLHIDEVLIALAVSASTNPSASYALNQLSKLKDTEMHSSVILSQVDVNVIKKLGIKLTMEPKYPTKNLFQSI